MIQVLEIHDNRTATVSTENLFRVVLPDGRSIGEMLPSSEAEAIKDAYDACNEDRAKIVGYSEVS